VPGGGSRNGGLLIAGTIGLASNPLPSGAL
jgi:hypothetical protein